MIDNNHHGQHRDSGRLNTRVHTVEKISVIYEGRTEEVAERLPDVSPRGMFISTRQRFPEGAVLNLSFRLALSGAEIQTRCEVRYTQPGVGVGVEFIGISPEAARQIENEVDLWSRIRSPQKPLTKNSAQRKKRKVRLQP